ncbi:unnamed protein product, partial [Darwinula stevensoni]
MECQSKGEIGVVTLGFRMGSRSCRMDHVNRLPCAGMDSEHPFREPSPVMTERSPSTPRPNDSPGDHPASSAQCAVFSFNKKWIYFQARSRSIIVMVSENKQDRGRPLKTKGNKEEYPGIISAKPHENPCNVEVRSSALHSTPRTGWNVTKGGRLGTADVDGPSMLKGASFQRRERGRSFPASAFMVTTKQFPFKCAVFSFNKKWIYFQARSRSIIVMVSENKQDRGRPLKTKGNKEEYPGIISAKPHENPCNVEVRSSALHSKCAVFSFNKKWIYFQARSRSIIVMVSENKQDRGRPLKTKGNKEEYPGIISAKPHENPCNVE